MAFSEDIRLHSLYMLHRRIAILSDIVPQLIDCCPANCCAYTGNLIDKDTCPYCLLSRFKSNGKPEATFEYIPMVPRLQALFQNSTFSQRLRYRTERKPSPNHISDIFDGSHFKSLLKRHVVIDGIEYSHKFFDDWHDIPTGILGDGFQMFKRARKGHASAWPFILINYGLNPNVRTHIENIMPLFIIGGPTTPKDFNSFLYPFIEESKSLAIGVKTFDAADRSLFTLRSYPIVNSGDMIAIRYTQGMKGPNAFSPCRLCRIYGFRDVRGKQKTYYVPLTPPFGTPESNDNKEWDPLNLPMRTDNEILQQIAEIQRGQTKTERERRAKTYGINGKSILFSLPSISPTNSFPFEGMHLLFENHIPNLVKLWKGTYAKGLDEGTGEYVIPDHIWEIIGKETVAAVKTIPSAFVSRLQNIYLDPQFYTAEAWSFWFVHLAPHLLKGRFRKEKYYRHMLQLVDIIKIILQFDITRADVEILRAKVVDYIQKYEKYRFNFFVD